MELQNGTKTREQTRKKLCDDLLELLLIAYTYGCEDANEMIGTQIAPTYDEMNESIYRKVAGKDFEQRVGQYVLEFAEALEYADENKSASAAEGAPEIPKVPTPPIEDIMRIAETDSHRVYNEAGFNTAGEAIKSGAVQGQVMKTWLTKNDDRVRDTHQYLEGTKIPYDAEFVTYDGDHAEKPGEFEQASNNVNCRCMIWYSIE